MEKLVFNVMEESDGTFIARAIGHSIFTEADTEEELKQNIEEVVKMHFDNITSPLKIDLHFTRDESFEIA